MERKDYNKEFDDLEEMFSSPGWRIIVEEAQAQLEQFKDDLTMAPSWEVVCELRGQIIQLNRLLSLPYITEKIKEEHHKSLEYDNADL